MVNNRFNIGVIIVAMFFVCCKNKEINSNRNILPDIEDSYMGQKRPGLTPEPFAPGIEDFPKSAATLK